MIRKTGGFLALILIQFVIVGMLVMAYAKPGQPSQFTWLNDFGVRGRTLLLQSPNAIIDTVRDVWQALPPHATPTVGVVDMKAGVIKATGYGVAPLSAEDSAQGQLMALDAAQLDAERNLISTLAGAGIKSQRISEGHVTEKHHIEEASRAHLQGATITDTRYNEDGSVEVDMEVNLIKQ